MMNGRKIIPLLALLALIAVLAIPAHGQTGIIVNDAATVRQEGVSLDTGLSSATSSVSPRIVLQYANTKREERIAAPPSALQALFAQVPARIVLQYANTVRPAPLLRRQPTCAPCSARSPAASSCSTPTPAGR